MKNAIWLAALLLLSTAPLPAAAQPLPKARVADLVRKVEDGVDEFRNYLEKRGDEARDRNSGKGNERNKDNAKARKDRAEDKKDELDDALGDLNRSTNRLRRKFDATDTWMETKGEVEAVVDDGRKLNQYVARGSYGSEVSRIWAALRTQINELARTYNVPPLAR